VTEPYEQLLREWYGEDLSLFNSEDPDLATLIYGLTRNNHYWTFNPNTMTSYEKLRAKYDVLLSACEQLFERCQECSFCDAAPARKRTGEKTETTQIESGRVAPGKGGKLSGAEKFVA
jgi:hypothetical protein